MKRGLACLLAIALLCTTAAAQVITMDDAHVAFNYPEDWLVVSPQLALVYRPLLEMRGIDAQALSAELRALGVQSRAYNADFSEWLSVQTFSDDLSDEIYDIERVTDAQRKTLKNRVEDGSLWETTGLRETSAEWQREDGVYWLCVQYTRTSGDQTIGRGLRYITVRNGMYLMLDWQTDGRRFTNNNLRTFRDMLSDVTITEQLPEPMHAVRLTATIPAETNTAAFTIDGTATAGATLTATAPDSNGERQVLSVGEVGDSGRFSFLVELEKEGLYDVTLTASLPGMLDSSLHGYVAYSANTLPVSLDGIAQDTVISVTGDTTLVTGETLSGVQLQLITPFGITQKRVGSDGKFSFELTTNEERTYSYILVCDKDGFDRRRIEFSLTREMTDEQRKQQIRDQAVAISYRNLQQNREADQGKTMRIYGPVFDISASGQQQYVRMYYNKDGNGKWYNPVVVTAKADMGVKVGDMITVVVTVDGVYEEQDDDGNSVNVPRLALQFVDAIE